MKAAPCFCNAQNADRCCIGCTLANQSTRCYPCHCARKKGLCVHDNSTFNEIVAKRGVNPTEVVCR